jgi:hypothetical protein
MLLQGPWPGIASGLPPPQAARTGLSQAGSVNYNLTCNEITPSHTYASHPTLLCDRTIWLEAGQKVAVLEARSCVKLSGKVELRCRAAGTNAAFRSVLCRIA